MKKTGAFILFLFILLAYQRLQSKRLLPTVHREQMSTAVAATTVFPVVRVIDGDTIVVRIGDQNEKVRLIGINTPETVDPRKPVQCFGVEASAKMKELVEDKEVVLKSDSTQTDKDKYGRLLRYVYLENGISVNEFMIEEGYAYEYTYHVPYEFQADYKKAQRKAEVKGLGLWAPGVCKK